MPKVLEYTPSWLCRPSEGYNLFSVKDRAQLQGSNKLSGILNGKASDAEKYLGATRSIARRGTEIFVLVENKIRWSDLCMLQETFQEDGSSPVDLKVSSKDEASRNFQDSDLRQYRVS